MHCHIFFVCDFFNAKKKKGGSLTYIIGRAAQMEGKTVCKNPQEAVLFFAKLLDKAAEVSPEREARKKVAQRMFAGDKELLEESYSFEEMFRSFDEFIEVRQENRGMSSELAAVRRNLVSQKGVRDRRRLIW